jgi:hypothetical protein
VKQVSDPLMSCHRGPSSEGLFSVHPSSEKHVDLVHGEGTRHPL